MWQQPVTIKLHELSFFEIERPKSNPAILKVILRIKEVKTVLETVLRLRIESTALEEIALENVTKSVKKLN